MSIFVRLKLKSQEAGEQLSEILNYYEEEKLQIEIKTPTFTTNFLLPDMRFNDHNGLIHISSDSPNHNHISIELHKENASKIEDTFFMEEIMWRKAAYEIQLKDGTTISIDILD